MSPHVERLGQLGRLREVDPPSRGKSAEGAPVVAEITDGDGYRHYRADPSVARAAGAERVRWLAIDLDLSDVDASDSGSIVAKAGEIAAAGLVTAVIPALETKFYGAAEDRLVVWRDGTWAPAESTLPSRATVLVHGFASSPEGSFGALPRALEGEGPVLALRHHTLSRGPITNALALVNSLAEKSEIDLLTYSRGGLVGELLCLATQGTAIDEAIAWLKRTATPESLGLGAQLGELRDAVEARRVSVRRFVRVACPAAGTSLAGDRLPSTLSHLLNVMEWSLPLVGAGDVAATAFSFAKAAFLSIIARRADSTALPGLAAMRAEGLLVRALAAVRAVDLPLFPIGLASRGLWRKDLPRWLGLQASRLVFSSDHDFVVDTASMSAGIARSNAAHGWVQPDDDGHHFSYFAQPDTRAAVLAALTGQDVPPAEAPTAAATLGATRNAEPSRRRDALLIADACTIELEHMGTLRWPDAGVILRGEASADQWTARARVRGYEAVQAALRARGIDLQLCTQLPANLPEDVVVIGHGTGAALLPGDGARTLAVGLGGSIVRRRELLEARVRELLGSSLDPGSERVLAQRLVREPGPVPRSATVLLAADDDRHRGMRTAVPFGRLLEEPAVLDAIARFVRDEALGAFSGTPGAAPPRTIEPLPRLPTAQDLVRAALGAEPAPAPRPVQVEIVHGALTSAARKRDEPATALIVPKYDGEPVAEEHRDADGTGEIAEQEALGILPADGHHTLLRDAGARWGARDVVVVSALAAHAVNQSALARSVTRAILALGTARRPRSAPITVAMALLGSGPGEAISVEEAAIAIAEAAADAASKAGVEIRLRLTERHEDLAIRAARALSRHAAVSSRIAFEGLALGRGYRGARALRPDLAQPRRWGVTYEGSQTLVFEVDDRRAATKVIRYMVPGDAASGRLLLPTELRDDATAGALEIVLDDTSAAYPWETVEIGGRPHALLHPVIRKLKGARMAGPSREALEARAIVIGDPRAGGGALPGAREESGEISTLLDRAGYRVETLTGGSGSDALQALLRSPTRVLHIAAHGTKALGGAVALGDGIRLDPALAGALDAAPAVVVLNACDAGAAGLASLARVLMGRGTRAFVGAATPVGDDAALVFARELYQAMLAGSTFGDAVRGARAAVEAFRPGAWSGYQCYGDASFTLRGVASVEGRLVSAAEVVDAAVTLMGDAQVAAPARVAELQARARALASAIDRDRRLATGPSLDRVGSAHRVLGLDGEAAQLFEKALTCKDARLETVEYLAEIRLRLGDARTAAAMLGSLVCTAPSAERYRLLALIALANRKRSNAREAYAKAADLAAAREEHGLALRIWAERTILAFNPGPIPSDGDSSSVSTRDRLTAALATLAQGKSTASEEIVAAVTSNATLLGRRAAVHLLTLLAANRKGERGTLDQAVAALRLPEVPTDDRQPERRSR